MLATAVMLAFAISALGAPAEPQVAVSAPGEAGSRNSTPGGYAPKPTRLAVGVVIVSLSACLPGCAARVPVASPSGSATRILETREGLASYCGKELHGRQTASGIRFDMNAGHEASSSAPRSARRGGL